MAIQQLNRGQSGLGLLAQALGAGLGENLQQHNSLSALTRAGFTPQEASLISRLPAKEQAPFFEALISQGAPQQNDFLSQLGGMGNQQIGRQQFGGEQIGPFPGNAEEQAIEPIGHGQSRLQRGIAARKAAGEQKLLRKETQKFREDIADKARTAKNTLHDLERLEELEATGKLDTPGYTEFLKRSGFDISALLNPESQEFEKIASGFIREARNIFGARISNFELDRFLKTIPSLSQSPEGRKRVISNLKYFNRAALAYNDASNEVLRENKYQIPGNFREAVDKKVDRKMNQISDRLKKDLAKEVPPAQNRLSTALQATLGSAIGGGKALAPAITGAGIGARFGGVPGALVGGGLGLLFGAGRGGHGGISDLTGLGD